MRNFRTLDVWKQAIQLVKSVYLLSAKLPDEEKYGLRSQINRASVSVPSNIAEGSSRQSQIEFKRFLEIALGSLFEIETQLIIIEELNLLDKSEIEPVLEQVQKEERMVNGLMQKIQRDLK